MAAQGLNETQLYLLKLFSVNHSKKNLDELKDVIMKFYAEKAKKQAEELMRSGKVTKEKLREAKKQHFRTVYK